MGVPALRTSPVHPSLCLSSLEPPVLTDRQPFRVLVLTLSAGVVLSGAAMVVLAAMTIKTNPMAAFVMALELVVVLAGAFGVLIGLGRIRTGQAVTLLCVGAAGAVASQVGPLVVDGQLAGVQLRPYALGRLALGAGLILVAGLVVLSRRPSMSVPMLVKGMLWGAPLVAALAISSGFGPLATVKESISKTLTGLPNVMQIIVALGAFAAFCLLISASMHYLIRAFIVGVEAAEQTEAAART